MNACPFGGQDGSTNTSADEIGSLLLRRVSAVPVHVIGGQRHEDGLYAVCGAKQHPAPFAVGDGDPSLVDDITIFTLPGRIDPFAHACTHIHKRSTKALLVHLSLTRLALPLWRSTVS